MAFVLCWLPFHIGRTIFVFSLGAGADRQNLDSDESIINNVGGVTKDARADWRVNPTPPYSSQPPTRSQPLHPRGVPKDSARPRPSTLTDKTRRSNGSSAASVSGCGLRSAAATPAWQSNATRLAKEPRSDSPLYFLYYLSQYFNLGSSVLYYLSAAVNPLLYNVMSARYRHAVRDLLRARSQRRGSRFANA